MQSLTLSQRIGMAMEAFMMTRLVPLHGPGRIMSSVFRIPLAFYRLGLYCLVPPQILILTTTGRKTGKLRQTPLEFSFDPRLNTYTVMAGWGGTTDWYRNARAHTDVMVQLCARRMRACAEPLTEDEVAAMLGDTTRRFPGALKIWSRWAGEELDGSPESLRRAAPYFPALRLRVEKE